MTSRDEITLGFALLLGLAGCSDDGGSDDERGETETGDGDGDDEVGDGDGDPGDGDGDPGDGDGDPGDGDGESGDGDGDPGDGDGDPGDLCGDRVVPNMSFEEAFDSVEEGWARAERWVIDSPAIPEDPFFPDARSEWTGQQLEFFDLDPTPAPNMVLLQFGPGWDTAEGNPVLLVHGADDPPDRAWANPNILGPWGCGDAVCPDTGLMQDLAAAGIPVFAIVFPNKQGDNYMWIEQIHGAIQVIRELTCAEQVDLIGWSKGAFAARHYVSGVTEDWGTPYAGEVRKLVLIGGPNLGMDYPFRYGSNNNSTVWPPGMLNGPTPHHEQLVNGVPVDRSEHAIYETAGGYYYRGQAQMLASWIDTYELSAVANNGLGPYAVVDSLSTYYGEDMYAGAFARGKGLAFAEQQNSIVDEIVAAGIPAEIETYLLCGEISNPVDYMVGFPNEISGPSDGVVFVDSCMGGDGIGNLVEASLLQDVNHLELGWRAEPVETVLGWLGQ